MGMNTPGGFGEYINVPLNWVVKKPSSLTSLEAMSIGTAGLTAAASVAKNIRNLHKNQTCLF